MGLQGVFFYYQPELVYYGCNMKTGRRKRGKTKRRGVYFFFFFWGIGGDLVINIIIIIIIVMCYFFFGLFHSRITERGAEAK